MLNAAREILKKLIDNGYEAYIVGGYVRDSLVNIDNYDIDITTSAKPEELENLFEIIDNGSKYGSVTIKYKSMYFEVTTFRSDLEYKDNRHPIISYSDNLEDDLKRRDYTINAMCIDYFGNIIDKYDGLVDLKNKTVKCIGDPNIRFKEDSLRILRGLYLVAKLDFDIENNTFMAMCECRDLLLNISKSKCSKEMTKIITYNKNNKVLEYIKKADIFNLSDSCDYLIKNNIIINDPLLFYAYLSYNNKDFFIELDKINNRKIKKIKELSNDNITKYDIIEYELDVLKYCNELRKILKKEYIKNFDEFINGLTIRSYKDIDISSKDILNITKKAEGSWLKDLKKDIAHKILDGTMLNKKDEIIKYVLKVVK